MNEPSQPAQRVCMTQAGKGILRGRGLPDAAQPLPQHSAWSKAPGARRRGSVGPPGLLFFKKTCHCLPVSVAMETEDDVTWTSCRGRGVGTYVWLKGNPEAELVWVGASCGGGGGDLGLPPSRARGHQAEIDRFAGVGAAPPLPLPAPVCKPQVGFESRGASAA